MRDSAPANNFSAPLQRIKAYARSASEGASAGDFEAALLALEIVRNLCDETAWAIRAEDNRRRALEVRGA